MIIQELTELYGAPIKGRDDMVRWVIRGKDGVEVSVAHSKYHMCCDSSAEVAYVHKGHTKEPGDVTADPYVLSLFGDDTVAGFCTLEDIQHIVAAVQ